MTQDVIGRRGQYGRFAERWFSKKGWSTERRRNLGMSTDEGSAGSSIMRTADTRDQSRVDRAKESSSENDIALVESGIESRGWTSPINKANKIVPQDVAYALLPKLLQTSKLLLSSRSFFFSYTCDITRRLGVSDGVKADIPLHRSVDPLVRSQCF